MSLALRHRRLVINWKRVGSLTITILAALGYIILIAVWLWLDWYTKGPS